MRTPAWRLKSSDAMCPVEPLPEVPYEILPGWERASAISSFRVCAGRAGFAISTWGTRQVSVMPVKSFSGS